MKENDFLDGVSNVEGDVVEGFISIDNKLQGKADKVKTKSKWIRFGAVAACFVLIASAVVIVPMLRETDPGLIAPFDTTSDGTDDLPLDGTTAASDGTTDLSSDGTTAPLTGDTTDNEDHGNTRLLHWADVSLLFGIKNDPGTSAGMYEKAFCEITSGVYSAYRSGDVIYSGCVGEKIDIAVVRTGWFQSWNNAERDVYEVNAEIYEIKGIDSTVSVAVKYLEKPVADTIDDFYVYSNPYVETETISEFLELYNAETHMNLYTTANIIEYSKEEPINYLYKINEGDLDKIKSDIIDLTSTVTYSKYTDADIRSIENIIKDCKQRLQLNIGMQSAGRRGIVYILDNGYICFTGFSNFFALYYIGSAPAEALIDTVKDSSNLPVLTNPEDTISYSAD